MPNPIVVTAYGTRTADDFGQEPWIMTPARKKEARPFMYTGVAISGKIASGKTLLATMLSGLYDVPVRHFAQALKDDVTEALYFAGLACSQAEIMAKYKGQLRGMLQDWGSIFRLVNGEDYWVEALFKSAPPPYIIDDMRYKNELAGSRARGLLTVRLEVAPAVQLERVAALYPEMSSSQLRHQSETDLDDRLSLFDVVVPATVQTPEALKAFWSIYVAPRYEFTFVKKEN